MARPRKIMAVYDANQVTVYQLCTPKDAKRAIRENSLVHLSNQPQIWIQPSFVWSMVRSAFGRKTQVVAVDMSKEGFLWALENSCIAPFDAGFTNQTKEEWEEKPKQAPVVARWDPDLDLSGRPVGYDCLRLGLTGEALTRFVRDWVVNVRDVSTRVDRISDILGHGWDVEEDDLPGEEEYPLYDEGLVVSLGMSSR